MAVIHDLTSDAWLSGSPAIWQFVERNFPQASRLGRCAEGALELWLAVRLQALQRTQADISLAHTCSCSTALLAGVLPMSACQSSHTTTMASYQRLNATCQCGRLEWRPHALDPHRTRCTAGRPSSSRRLLPSRLPICHPSLQA